MQTISIRRLELAICNISLTSRQKKIAPQIERCITIKNGHVLNNKASKYKKQTLAELRRKTVENNSWKF